MILTLIVFTFLVFINTSFHPFVHDDLVFIVQNSQIGRLDHWLDIFNHVSQQAGAAINSYYRPILEIVYRLEYRLFGFNVAGFHLVNIIIHVINGLMVFTLLRKLNFSKWTAYGVALIFLIHPVQTEAVACVAGISNLLVTFFVLFAMYFYLREEYIVVCAALTLAFLTKEEAVMAPLLFVLLDWYQQKKNRFPQWFVLGLFTAGFLWLRDYTTESHMLQDIMRSPGELRLRLLAIPRTLLMYLRLMTFPNDLHYYRNTDILQPNAWGFYVLGGLSAGLIYLSRIFKANGREVVFGLAWFLIGLLPVLNVVPLVNEYSFIMTAEHFLYLPVIGLAISLGALLRPVISAKTLPFLLIVAILCLGGRSIYQNTFWSGEIPLFERMVQFEPKFGRGQILLARAYEANQQWDLAIQHYNVALDIMTGYSKKSVNANATRFYQGFIKDLNANLAQCFLKKGQWEQALPYFQKILQIDPQDVATLNNIAICYLQIGDKAQAEQYFKMALGFNPTYAPARDNLNKLIVTP